MMFFYTHNDHSVEVTLEHSDVPTVRQHWTLDFSRRLQLFLEIFNHRISPGQLHGTFFDTFR